MAVGGVRAARVPVTEALPPRVHASLLALRTATKPSPIKTWWELIKSHAILGEGPGRNTTVPQMN